MVAESYNLNANIQKILTEIQPLTEKFNSVELYNGYGGWSVTSVSGSYQDGWNREAIVVDEKKNQMDLEQTHKNFSRMNLAKDIEHVLPTEFCSPEIKKVLTTLTDLGLNPCRSRLHYLKANSDLYWHLDAPENVYAVRLHIPLITNENCFFETTSARIHMPANGSAYFVKVNTLHRVVNQGTTDRLHLVVNVKDTLRITTQHQWTQPA